MRRNKAKMIVSAAIWITIGVLIVSYAESNRTLEIPEYISEADSVKKRLIYMESAVFDVIDDNGPENLGFSMWFNGLNDEHKRGFILYVRSVALSSLLGQKEAFSDKDWTAGRSRATASLTREFMTNTNIEELRKEYISIIADAEKERAAFLRKNSWLKDYLGENFNDFEEGLLYFFCEHLFSYDEVDANAARFLELRPVIGVVSAAIINDKGANSRISPRADVSDNQIREIVAASFFTELFYGIPTDYMLLISAFETNFAMEFWYGGSGTTQQTLRAANTVLQSDYWIEKVQEASGVRIRHQMVPVNVLDNVFLCMTEAAKTISIKVAELNIRTSDIKPSKNVMFAGKSLPVTWATAYKYNGSKKYAKQYAGGIHYYYKSRKWWLKSIEASKYQLYALRSL
ncbi:MAG: hypothetical protein JSV21_08845 [Nitrospirota bacterium]|nr:MAG: hypothetical protein JSV21_08845 [Nitrospirota bacterium]